MRQDFLTISEWLENGQRVLDLGCGDGALLHHLKKSKSMGGLGIEIQSDNINQCIANGVSVVEQNIDDGLSNFADNSFDTVLLTQTLQAVKHPDLVLKEMLRVGKQCIVTFPNFGFWQARLHLLFKGEMPVSDFMPYSWYDTPNIHFCTVDDFENLCEEIGVCIERRYFHEKELNVDVQGSAVQDVLNMGWRVRNMPNLFCRYAMYLISSES